MQILVVDDSPTIRAGLRIQLERMGHSITEAVDGVHALKLWHAARPDLVLIDVMMPQMDGYEAARRMRGENHEDWETNPHNPPLERNGAPHGLAPVVRSVRWTQEPFPRALDINHRCLRRRVATFDLGRGLGDRVVRAWRDRPRRRRVVS